MPPPLDGIGFQFIADALAGIVRKLHFPGFRVAFGVIVRHAAEKTDLPFITPAPTANEKMHSQAESSAE